MSRRPDDTANLAMRLRVLTATYSSDRVEAACELARSIGKRSAVTVESILAKGTDRLQIDAIDRPDMHPTEKPVQLMAPRRVGG